MEYTWRNFKIYAHQPRVSFKALWENLQGRLLSEPAMPTLKFIKMKKLKKIQHDHFCNMSRITCSVIMVASSNGKKWSFYILTLRCSRKLPKGNAWVETEQQDITKMTKEGLHDRECLVHDVRDGRRRLLNANWWKNEIINKRRYRWATHTRGSKVDQQNTKNTVVNKTNMLQSTAENSPTHGQSTSWETFTLM